MVDRKKPGDDGDVVTLYVATYGNRIKIGHTKNARAIKRFEKDARTIAPDLAVRGEWDIRIQWEGDARDQVEKTVPEVKRMLTHTGRPSEVFEIVEGDTDNITRRVCDSAGKLVEYYKKIYGLSNTNRKS